MRVLIGMICVLFYFGAVAQVKYHAPKKPAEIQYKKAEPKFTTMGFGVGLTRSVIFLSRNVREFNDATGFNLGVVYGGNKLARIGLEYHQYNAINIEPTWYNIKAKTFEANIHFLARFKKGKAVIYPLTGISVNQFNGYFTGKEDFQNLRDKYGVNTQVKSYWIGANFGLGYEHQLGPIKVFLLYKMRIGTQDSNEKINIIDVCYSLGLRYDFRALTIKHAFNSIFRSYRNRYTLDAN